MAINRESDVKKFMCLHCGFEQPTPEIMEAWGAWFESIADVQLEQGGFAAGRRISKEGTEDLPWGMKSITGYNIVEAESMDLRSRWPRVVRISQASESTGYARAKAEVGTMGPSGLHG